MSRARLRAACAVAAMIAAGPYEVDASAAPVDRTDGERTVGRIAYCTYELKEDRTGAFQDVYTSSPSGTGARLVARDATDPVWSRDGRWLAYVRGEREVWRVRADGAGNRRVSPRGVRASDPAWSPDGRRLAYTETQSTVVGGYPDERATVYVVGREGGKARRLHRGHSPAWSPDGRVIVFADRGVLATIKPSGTRFRVLRDDIYAHNIRFSPVARKLVFTSTGGDPQSPSRVRTLDLRTGSLRTVWRRALGGHVGNVVWTPDGRRLAYLLDHFSSTDGNLTHVVNLFTIRPDGSHRRHLAALGPEVASWYGVSWVG